MKNTRQVNPKVSIRIIQTRLALQKESRSELRATYERSLEEDERLLGPATLPAESHRQMAVKCRQTAENTQDEKSLDLLREATAHALWANDEDLAVACYHSFVRLRALIEQL